MQTNDSASRRKLFWREFWILWGAGVVSAAVAALISGLPVTPVADRLFLGNVLSRGGLLDVIEGVEIVLETAIIVGVGLLAARSLGLGAPFLERWLRGERISVHGRSLLIPALLIGVDGRDSEFAGSAGSSSQSTRGGSPSRADFELHGSCKVVAKD
jgi:hypothetical protein